MEERPKKSPRAFCSGIKVPDEVKLVIMPKAGHAGHFGCVNPDLAVEYKRLGDNSITETFAFLLEYLLTDENWLRQNTPLKEAKEYLDFLYLKCRWVENIVFRVNNFFTPIVTYLRHG